MHEWNVAPELSDRVQREVEAGERIAWMGSPIPRLFSIKDLPVILFAIPWTAFALFWTGMALWSTFGRDGAADGSPWWLRIGFPLFGLPFILIGVGMFLSPLWRRFSAQRTVFALTDRRALIIQGGWWTTVRSFRPDQLEALTRRERRDGSGDLIFEQRTWRDSDGDRRSTEVGFQDVANVREVEALVRVLGESKPSPPTS